MSGTRGGVQSIRGRGGAQKLAAAIKANPDLQKEILEAPDRVYLYDKNAPSVKARRARSRNEFLTIMRGVLNTDEDVLSDHDLYKKLFAPDAVIDHVISYINAIASAPVEMFPGKFGKMKISTMRQRTEALWWFAGWEAGNRAAEIWTAWNLRVPAALHQNATTYDFGTGKFAKEYFAVPELRLLFSVVCSQTRYVDWYKQHYVAWVMAFVTGVRPGTLGLSKSYTDTSKEIQAIRWEDIHFLRFEDQPGIFLRIHYKWLKGQRDPYHAKAAGFDGAHFLVHPCNEPENLVVDLTWLLTCLGIDRGLFGANASLEMLLNSPDSELKQDPVISKQPIFLALKGANNTRLHESKPLRANMFNPPLQRMAHAAGLAVRVTMYVFRREFITTMGRNLSVEEAKTLATHRSEQLGSYGRYDFGTGDLSIAKVVTGENPHISEAARERNKYRRRISSAAVLNRADFPDDEADVFVAQIVQSDAMLVDFEESLVTLLDAARLNFGIKDSSSVKHTLDALNAIPAESSISESWELSDGMDRYDPATYISQMDLVYSQGAAYAASFLSKFLQARKIARTWVIRAAHRNFERQWMIETSKPSAQQVRERLSEATQVPDILDMPDNKSKRSASELSRANTTISESKLSREVEAEARDDADLGLEVDEAEALDLTAFDDDGENTLQNLEEELEGAHNEDEEVDDEVDTNMFDVFELPSGPITAYLPGESGEDDQAMEPSESAEVDVNPLAAKEYYQLARQQCIEVWFDCAEVTRGECECRLCKYSVHGNYKPSFLRQKPTGTVYSSADHYNRHLRGTLHDPEACQFALWALHRAKGVDGAYICPFQGCVASKFRRLQAFKAHVKKMHGAFYTRLYH